MALGVHTECTKRWKLDDLALIVDSLESHIADAVQAQHIKADNNYLNELPLYLATCSLIFIVSITCKELQLDDKYMNKELNDLAAFYLKSSA